MTATLCFEMQRNPHAGPCYYCQQPVQMAAGWLYSLQGKAHCRSGALPKTVVCGKCFDNERKADQTEES